MANLKTLAKDTAIYGMTTMCGRFLNYLLVPLYTAKMSAESGGYGVVTNMYAYVALFMILLTFGMETTVQYFAKQTGLTAEGERRVFSTAIVAVGTVSVLFVAAVIALLGPVSTWMGYADHPEYVWVMALTVAVDAVRSIPFVYLRLAKRALRFATLYMVNIGMSIVLNCIYYIPMGGTDPGMAFNINLLCSVVLLVLMVPELRLMSSGCDLPLLRRMLAYSWPILMLGIAGILNQTFDKMCFDKLYTGDDWKSQLGIYGAAVKIAMVIAIAKQAFSYAYEPFIMSMKKGRENDDTQALATKFFVIFSLLAFLVIMGYIDLLKLALIPNRDYWVGLSVVPIVMAAELMMGVYFNLSFWYKLDGKTFWGAVFSGVGCLVLIVINVVFVPRYSYMACAWGGFAAYGTAMVLSYVVGQHYHPINYPLRQLAVYLLLAVALFTAMQLLRPLLPVWASVAANTLLIALYVAYILKHDLPLKSIPVINHQIVQS